MKRVIATLDAETDPFKYGRIPKPFVWGFDDGEVFRYFTPDRWERMIAFIRTNSFEIYVHNGGKFDFALKLFEEANPGEVKIINGRIGQFHIGESILKDSMLIYPEKLENFKKDSIDYSIFEANKRHKPENWEKIIAYLKTDCRALRELVSYNRNEYGRALTIASQAKQYAEKLMGIKMPRSTKGYFNKFRPYYYGGRNECFQKGIFTFNKENPLQGYDIRSAYPFAMTQPIIWGMDNYGTDNWPKDSELHKSFLRIEGPSVGAFPYREIKSYLQSPDPDAGDPVYGPLSFPHDGKIREFYITGYEFVNYLSTNQNLPFKIISANIFKQTITFGEYINYFYKLKLNSKKNSLEYLFAKRMMNSLYGKFAANPKKYRKYLIRKCSKDPPPEGYEKSNISYPWDFFQRRLSNEEQRFYDISCGACITGYVRGYLYKMLVQNYGSRFWEDKRLFYTDTDCIKGQGIKLPTENALGNFELETIEGDSDIEYAAFAGKKLYSCIAFNKGQCNRSKGAHLSAGEIFSVGDGNTVNWKSDAPTFNIKSGNTVFLDRDIKMT